MRFLGKLLLWIVTLSLLGLLAVVVLLKFPTTDPPFTPSKFAPRPKMDRLPPIKIEVLETGTSDVPDAFASQEGSLLEWRRLIHPAILIHHPKGTVIFESGFSTQFSQQLKQASFLHRIFDFFKLSKGLGDFPQIKEMKAGRDFFIVSHVHWDHLGGTLDLPQLPVRVLPEEWKFATTTHDPFSHGIFPHQIEALKDRIQALELKDVPYENFPKSLDLFGDQSLVVVPLPGHTPGSLGMFVNLPNGKRYFLIGDAAWGVDAEGNPEPRSLLAELISDQDHTQTRTTRQKLQELIEHSNEVILVPTHDTRALEKVKIGTTAETQPHAQVSSEKPIGAKAGQKEGIYTVGRAFKSAGGSMEKGFKAAGRGIKKGMIKTGDGFQKAGSSIKNFFTGETGSKKTEGGK